MSKKTSRYQCGTGSKFEIMKVPEGIDVNCGGSWIVNIGTKCKVSCGTGTPNYSELTCKTSGWRPTKEIKCEGVEPGVIIGVLIGGLAVVILIAFGYAKYKQRIKAKNGTVNNSSAIRAAKLNQINRRPGRTGGVIVGADTPNQGYDRPDRDRQIGERDSRGSGPRRSNRSSRNGSEPGSDNGQLASKAKFGGYGKPSIPQQNYGGRGHVADVQTSHNRGYRFNNYQGGALEDIPPPANPPPYNGYYQQSQPVSYGYPSAPQDPSVGYGAFPQSGQYPPSRDLGSRPYRVPT
ncbi:uncharacterized protein LOC143460519 isoform X1 [Clavelina lepadiformis]|uniref:uncharacterized protein LOC143460519 isoform X1 n=2 Tax=Clavelina lepadiformis TaxID=159417 RepID=UPI004041188A